MHVTPALRSDLPRIHEMICALSAFHGDEATVTMERLEDVLFTSGLSTAFVAREGDALIGYAGLNFTTEIHSGRTRIDIHHLFIEENHRAKGVGRALITTAKELGRAQGAKGVTIVTAPNNETAQAAYRAMGLKEITDAGPRFWIPVD
jgi:GNAT superfamily N-acetyltransferase